MCRSHRISGRCGVLLAALPLVVLLFVAGVGPGASPAWGADPGHLLWSDTLAASVTTDGYAGVAAAPDGGVYAVGTLNDDGIARAGMILVKYEADGSKAWQHAFYGGADRDGHGAGVAVDANGAVVAAGTSVPEGGDSDLMVVKYDAAGVFKWQKITSLSAGSDRATAIAVDGSGNVYVTARDGGATAAIWLVKYAAADGAELWRKSLYGPGDWAYPNDLAVDAAGNAYVVGEATLPDTTSEFLIAKWTPDGSRPWVLVFDGGHDGDDVLYDVVLSGTSSLYVSGRVGVDSAGRDIGFVAKYTRDGARLWKHNVSYSRTDYTWIGSIAVDRFGRLTAVGSYKAPSPILSKAFVTRWRASGKRLWTARYWDVRHRRRVSWGSVVCSGRGRLWCAGVIRRAGANEDWIVAGYTRHGVMRWKRTFAGADKGWDGPAGLCLGGGGSLYVPGTVWSAATDSDLVMRKYVR